MDEGRITEGALEEFRKRIGTELHINWQYNKTASREAIRNFTRGIGDGNPLWTDEEYARKTRYGCIPAPPSWLYSVFPTFVLQGLRGVHAFHSGNEWEFYKPVLSDDQIRPECIFTGFEEKPSKFAGNIIMEYQDTRYFNQLDKLVAKAKSWLVRAERGNARKERKYSKIRLPHPWKEEELKKIEEEIVNHEKIQGSEVRYWEDVEVGAELPPVIKGPVGLTDEMAFQIGCGANVMGHELALDLYKRRPSLGFRDPETFSMEPMVSVHWNKSAANVAGLPYPYVPGVEMQSWLIHFLTNWMGNEGWLKKNYAEYRFFIYFSDVAWFRGKVTRKYVDENGEYCVDIDTAALNQRGENAIPGHSTVILPSREKDTWPLETRLS